MLQVLRHRAFKNLWLGQAISQLGDAFYYVVFMFMVKKLTGSAAMVGLVGAVETLPFLLFSAYGGVLADRIDRRRIMLASDVLSGIVLVAFALAAFVFGRQLPVVLLVLAAFLMSSVRAFFLPAKNAAIPSVVPPDEIVQANSLSYMTQSWMPMIGLALSASVLGVLYGISEKWFFVAAIAVNAGSFFASAYYIKRLPELIPDREHPEERHPWEDFKQGIAYIKQRDTLRVLLILSVFMSLMISPFFVVFVEANDAWFGGKPQTLTWCEFTFFAGLIVGGLLVAKFNVRRPGLGYVWALAITGGSVAMMALSQNFWFFCLCNVIAGLAIPFCDIPINSYLQLTVDDAYRGRVNSALTMMRMGITPLGLGLAGGLVKSIGLVSMFAIMGLGMVLVALSGLASPAFRTSRMPTVTPRTEVAPAA